MEVHVKNAVHLEMSEEDNGAALNVEEGKVSKEVQLKWLDRTATCRLPKLRLLEQVSSSNNFLL